MAKRGSIEFEDYNGDIIELTDHYYQHIIDRHGSEMTKYVKSWEDTIKHPDYIGNSKKHTECKIYVQKNKKGRNYPAKYLVIVVNESKLITSIRFGSDLNFIEGLKEHDNETN